MLRMTVKTQSDSDDDGGHRRTYVKHTQYELEGNAHRIKQERQTMYERTISRFKGRTSAHMLSPIFSILLVARRVPWVDGNSVV